MLLKSKVGWVAIAFTLLTVGMLVLGFPRSAASDSNQPAVASFVIKSEIRKIQETLRLKGHYRGKVDGDLGLRTRASIRAYQKAENLAVTGLVDGPTARGLGVRPEASWVNSTSAGQDFGPTSESAAGDTKSDKPSAGIRRAARTTSKASRKEISRAALEDSREDGATKQP
jgi:peptidoglycan hydrolase-like protein with peptidoglycan-binding domain